MRHGVLYAQCIDKKCSFSLARRSRDDFDPRDERDQVDLSLVESLYVKK